MCKLYHYIEVGSDQDSRAVIMSVNLSIGFNLSTIKTDDSSANLLELAANNDVEGFERVVECEPSSIDEVGLWYGRRKDSNQMVLHHRTPLMVAATYGSIDVLKVILSSPEVDVNRCCGVDKDTALHCAASGGSMNAVNIVKLLLAAGANPNLINANGKFPLDITVVSPKCPDNKFSLQMLLAVDASFDEGDLGVSRGTSNSNSPPLSVSPGNGSPRSPDMIPDELNFNDVYVSSVPEKKEYPFDPSLPDIKNSIYSTDEFRMFSFKVRPCSRAYSHDWTECPFVHPGENARRRDPRKFHYSCVMCPDFRKGACRRGDMCEYAHGVFECWLHPAQYRTRLCKDGTSCNRRVCFFAHTQVELRPLYASTGSTVPSPRSITSASNTFDFAAAMNFLPGSPSSHPVMSPSPFSPPLSPSTNGITSTGWPPQQNVPALLLPGSNLQSSRLRSSSNARDVPPENSSLFADIDVHQSQPLDELSIQSQPSANTNMLNPSARSKTLTPSNLEEIFSAESSSPRYSDQALASAVFSPTHKSSIFYQFQQQQQNMLSPIKTHFSPRNIDHSMLQSPFGVPSPGRMSPCNVDHISPMNSRASMLAQLEKQHQQFRSLSSRDIGSEAAAAVSSLDDSWGSPNGIPGWAVTATELGRLKRSSSFETLNNGEEPDLSWVHLLVKESPQDKQDKSASGIVNVAGSASSSGDRANFSAKTEQVDQSVLGAWLEQMQLDQLMAQ
ncbi:zinc finger CCCH domain-containing protein 30-like [Primulina tabacum]|uniref:zinc finger CCCH domain-containing protein 30-like n=1 Tax=Primulina tabacum TaxID=48773 RepID=UPI003F5A2532